MPPKAVRSSTGSAKPIGPSANVRFSLMPSNDTDAFAGGASFPGVFRFTIHDVDVTIVNAIRRLILSRVPTVSFHFDTDTATSDDIRVLENTSSLHNEFIMHRVSLIPLHFNADETSRHTKSSIELTLDVTNETTEPIAVTTEHMVVLDVNGTPFSDAERRRILPPSHVTGGYVVIVRLKPGQRLALSCTPSVGTASEYAGRGAVSLCSYGMVVDDARADAALKASLAACKTEQEREAVRSDFMSHSRARHVFVDSRDRPCRFAFQIESECGLSPKWMVSFALRALVAEIHRARRDLAAPVLVESPEAAGGVHTFQWDFSPADHTMGSVVQAWMHDARFRDEPSAPAFVGYHCPHPLQQVVRLVVRFADDATAETATERVADSLAALESHLDSINPGWDA